MKAEPILIFTFVFSVSGQPQCAGGIGRNDTVPGDDRRNNELYINFGDPATCNGNITSISYCYFRPDVEATEYVTPIAVYRPQGRLQYRAVSPTIQLRKTWAETETELGDADFICSELTLDQPVTVQSGDVLGACLDDVNGDGLWPLDIAGFSGGESIFGDVLRTDNEGSSSAGCTATSAPNTVDFSTINVYLRSRRILHLSAMILAFSVFDQSQCSGRTIGHAGTDQGNATRDDRFYINRGDPATCNGTIASISYCYFRPDETVDEYVAPLAVYRSRGDGQYTAVSPTIQLRKTHTETETDLSGTDFVCSEFTLDQPVTVQRGDVLGACVGIVVDDNVRPLDIVGQSGQGIAEGDVLRRPETAAGCSSPSTTPRNVDTSMEYNQYTGVLYLTANIIAVPNIDSNSGVTAAIVIIVLIIVVVAVVALVVVVTLLGRKLKSKSLTITVKSNNNFEIDNQVYGLEQDGPATQHTSVVTQAQDHTYEFDTSYCANENEYAYSGPFEHTCADDSEVVYESPVDGTAVSYSKLLAKNKEEDIYVKEDPYEVPASRENDIYAQLNTWGVKQIKANGLEMVKHLGSGQFGSVEQGVWKRQGTRPVDVALKSLTKTSDEDKVKFLQEAAIMAQFRHPNVIVLYGIVTENNPMMLVVELAKKGDLREILFSMQPDPGELVPTNIPNMLLKFSQQVALGMQYLSAKGFVHRDLAARNVLVTSNSICKVADFGMSRDLANENYYVSQGKDKIPVKWTAPEAINYKKYSTASDVWAYGCLLYEIWSLGHKPFEEISNLEAIRLVDNGKRLSPPPGCPSIIYELMIRSWHPETSQRPVFRDIVLTLSGSEKVILNIPEEESSTNPLAGVLGAPLEAGENMYSEQKRRYETQSVTDGDYF